MELFKQPNSLDMNSVNLEESWKNWKQKFQNFMKASGSDQKPDDVQLAIFLHIVGDDALAVYNTFAFTEGESGKLQPALSKFEEYCSPRKNVVFERYNFWRSTQASGESIDTFVTTLRQKVKSCDFGNQTESLIRDRIVLGCPDARLQERLLREPDLDLLKALNICRAAESTKAQLQSIQGETSFNARIHNVHSNDIACSKCGGSHKPRACPAFGKKCMKCGKPNHFQKMCRSKSTSSEPTMFKSPPRSRNTGREMKQNSTQKVVYSVNDDNVQNFFVGVLSVGQRTDGWWKDININGDLVQCKLDTGAEANVMAQSTLNSLANRPKIKPCKTTLTAYGNSKITPVGIVSVTAKTSGGTVEADFFVIKQDAPTLLGLHSCIALNIVQRIDSLSEANNSSNILDGYKDVFTGLGQMPGTYHIKIDKNISPVVHAPRRVPLALEDKLKKTLMEMERLEVITKQDQPTDWVNSLLVVEKKDGSLRLCLDPRDLNKAIKREHYRIPTCEDVLAKLSGKSVFTVIDMKDGFWQIKLDESSSRLCTFNTPFGRYSMLRMPFGISSAPEIFQKRSNELFGDIPGVNIVFDDLIIAAADDSEHDRILKQVLDRAQKNGVKFNQKKIQYKVGQVKYLGHILSSTGVRPDDVKVQAILNMPSPTNQKELQRFLGMVTYLSKFIPNFSSHTDVLRQILKKDIAWHWLDQHENAVHLIKQLISEAATLKYYDPNKVLMIQTDASSTGLGSCLMQDGQPIAYASRSLTPAERNYAQIEKELLAIVFACERFSHYVYGRKTTVQSDHKPLEAIFRKPICDTSPRLQRMLLRLLKFQLTIEYLPGSKMLIADALSRAYIAEDTKVSDDLTEDLEVLVHALLSNFPASPERLEEFRQETLHDAVLVRLQTMVQEGFPESTEDLPVELKQYRKMASDIYELDGLMFVHGKLIVPQTMRHEMLALLHEGHLGIEKCKGLARSCLFWPGLSQDIEKYVGKCTTCNAFCRHQQKEPLIPHPVPERPWEKVAADIFQLFGNDYLLVVDYYSKYPEVCLLQGKTANSLIPHLKSIFARHGIPCEMVADNMPFASAAMQTFATSWKFKITTTSPRYAQSNGMAERAIQTVKTLLKKAEKDGSDPYIALLQYRNAPISGLQYSPAELLMSRLLRSKLPVMPSRLQPMSRNAVPELKTRQSKQETFYNRHAKALQPLHEGDTIRVNHNGQWRSGVVRDKHITPRSYIIDTEDGSTLRRNRRDLVRTNDPPPDCQPLVEEDSTPIFMPPKDSIPISMPPKDSTPNVVLPRESTPVILPPPVKSCLQSTRSGRSVKPPVRFRDFIT